MRIPRATMSYVFHEENSNSKEALGATASARCDQVWPSLA